MNIKKILGIAVGVALVGWILYGNVKQQETQSNEKRTIYALLPITGHLANIGEEYKTVIEFSMKEKNYPFKIKYVDSESNPMKGLTALQSATMDEQKPIVFSFISSVGSAVAPYIAQKNGFMFAVSSQSINAEVNNYQQVATSLQEQLDPLIQYILKNHHSVDIVYIMDEFGLAQKNYVVNTLNKQGLKNIRELEIPMNVSDPRNEVVKLLSQNPEVVFIIGNPTLGYINLFKILKESNFKGDILADAALSNPSVQKSIGKNANGVLSVAMKIETKSQLSDEERKLVKQLSDYGIKINPKPIQAIDTLNLIKYTLDNNLEFNRQTYERLTNWKSVSGDIVTFKNGLSTYPTILCKLKDGEYIPVEE